MNSQRAQLLRDLLASQPIASLGTLQKGEPFVSMVPFARVAGSADLLIHVSRLAAHTGDMLASPRVSLMVMAADAGTAQSRARVTLQADAQVLESASPEYTTAKAAYLARFPDAAQIFELGDFSMFRLRPVSARVVGGFAQAFSADAEGIAAALS
jgi:hypothetical protein